MIRFLHSLRHRQYVRPWALAAPVIVLIIALPLLRPLRRPTELSVQEAQRLASAASLVEHHRLIPSEANFNGEKPENPVFTLLLAGPYWVLERLGLSLSHDTEMVSYLLTVFCATLPAAMVPGLIYRMGRVFELRRPVRFGLSLAVALCSGVVSYATVINPHPAAAFFVLAAASSVIQSGGARRRSGAAILLAGFFAASAAVVDSSALAFLFLFPLSLLLLRGPWMWRMGAIIFFVIGTFPPLLLHGILSTDVISTQPAQVAVAPRQATQNIDEDDETRPGVWEILGQVVEKLIEAFFGSHGLLSHFPVVLLGLVGVWSVLRRHWPLLIKALAVLSIGAAITIIIWIAATGPSEARLMYGDQYFVAFTPLILFWAGAWLRQNHRPAIWATAGVLTGFSAVIGIIGAINPCPPGGYQGYTPVALLHHLQKN